MDEAVTILQSNNIKVEQVSFPSEFSDADKLKRIQKVITLGKAQKFAPLEYRPNKTKLAAEIRAIIENTVNITNEANTEVTDKYSRMRKSINNLAKRYTVVLTTSAVDKAPLGLDDMGRVTFNTLWTGFQMPIVNIPAFMGENSMPIGISLVGPRYRDQQPLMTSKIISKILMTKSGWKI
uniref:Amidase domain-containing protein n=1 Tax=Fusarium oxysporum (strain Fo5176) TaxID=660025 RepID=A0A0D2XT25_FUSOF